MIFLNDGGKQMLEDAWSELKSGSDVRGRAIDETYGKKINLTNEVTEKIFLAFALWVSKKLEIRVESLSVAIGHDSRKSATRLKTAAVSALSSVGINVYDCGLSSTPAMYTAISAFSCMAAVEITASHHPKDRNGFKFFLPNGGITENELEEILEMAQAGNFPPVSDKGSVKTVSALNYYCEKLKNVIKTETNSSGGNPLLGFKILVDAGGGAGGFFAEKVLKALGADTQHSLFLEPDGDFKGHVPNPENSENLKPLISEVKETGADLGIAFDTDVDRAALIGPGGEEINRCKLVALASALVLEKNKGGVIVTDSVTSDSLKIFIEKLGGLQFRYRRGYNHVIAMAKEICKGGGNCPLAIETSGHACFKENHFIDDGAYLAAKIIAKMVNLKKENRTLNSLLLGLKDAKEKLDFRIPITDQPVSENAEKMLENLKQFAKTSPFIEIEKENIEGVRMKFRGEKEKGWALARQSVHDPVIILYIESYIDGGASSILNILKKAF